MWFIWTYRLAAEGWLKQRSKGWLSGIPWSKNVRDHEFSPHVAGRGFSVILETLMILAQLSYTGSRFPTSSSSLSLGWQLMSWRVWNSFDKQDVKGHYDASDCNSSMQPGSNHSSFVEYTPHSLLLRQQPGFETRYFLEVGTGANKEQTKHQDPIQGVHVRHGDSARLGWGVRVQLWRLQRRGNPAPTWHFPIRDVVTGTSRSTQARGPSERNGELNQA